jgi:imidazole glycerol-phosphate synthase subunit HisH
MTNTVAVVDYGMGNLRSVAQAVMHAAAAVDHAQVVVTSDPQVVRDAHRVVLPGQGAMPDSRNSRMQSGMAPWPGNTTRSAARTSSGLDVINTR